LLLPLDLSDYDLQVRLEGCACLKLSQFCRDLRLKHEALALEFLCPGSQRLSDRTYAAIEAEGKTPRGELPCPSPKPRAAAKWLISRP